LAEEPSFMRDKERKAFAVAGNNNNNSESQSEKKKEDEDVSSDEEGGDDLGIDETDEFDLEKLMREAEKYTKDVAEGHADTPPSSEESKRAATPSSPSLPTSNEAGDQSFTLDPYNSDLE